MHLRSYAAIGASMAMSVLMLSGLADPATANAVTRPSATAVMAPAAHLPAAVPQAPSRLPSAVAKALALPGDTEQECPAPASPFQEQCLVLVDHARKPTGTVSPASAASVTAGGYSAANLRAAYGLASWPATAGTGMTVALVEAYNDPHLAADVAAYRKQYNLTPLTCGANGAGCLTIYNQDGAASPLPSATRAGWEDEAALDAEMVSAICPNCRIDVFEANSATLADLGTAENSAAKVADVISNSWNGITGSDFPGVSAFDSMYFDHPGVAITFAAGDSGYGAGYPASSQLVTSVGGTYLKPSGSGYAATAWSGSGAGCSAGEPQPAWEEDASGSTAANWCANRNENDVSAVANGPNGISLYSSSGDCNQSGHWCDAYGTSVSAPVVAALYALAGQPAAGTYPVSYLYQSANRADLKRVTSGSDGGCSHAYLCNAAESLSDGYNGPAGLGTPVSPAAFAGNGSGNVVSLVNPGTYDIRVGLGYRLPAVEARDSAAGQTLTYTAAGLPAGLSLDSATGAISGKVTAPHTALVHLTVTDGTGASSTVSFRIVAVNSMIASYHPGTGEVRLDLGGMCLNDAGNSSANGAKVRVWKCAGSASEMWRYLPSSEPGAAGTLRIHGKCLNVAHKGTRNGSRLNLYRCDGNANQDWMITGVAGQLYNPVSGKCVNDPGGSKRNGTQLVIWACNGTTRQAWTLPASPITSGVTGKCVNDAGNSGANRTHLVSWTCNGKVQQRFTIGLDGTVRIHGKCLNVVGQGTRDGDVVNLYTCTSAFPAEYWALTAGGMIQNPNSGKCLAIPGNSSGNGRWLRLEDCYGLPGEIWAVS